MRDLVLTLFIFGMIPMMLRHPYVGILMWSWISYMNPHRLTWSFAYDFAFAQLIAIVTLVSLLFDKERKSFPVTPITVIWILFLLWMGLTTLFAISPDDAFEQANKVAKIQLVSLLTLVVINTRQRLRLLVWVIAGSLAFFGIKGGIFTVLTGGGHRVWGPPGSFFYGNNELALALLMTIPLVNYLRITETNIWAKRGMLAAVVLMGISAIGSYSRGAFVAVGAVVFIMWLKSRSKIVTGVVATVLLAGMLAFMPESWHERMNSIADYEEDSSAVGRINAWYAAYNLASDRFFGGGFDGINAGGPNGVFRYYAPDPNDFHDAHSIYFEVLGDHGFIGLGLFLLLGIMSLATAGGIIRRTRGNPEQAWATELARMIQVSLVAYATGGAFLGLAYFDLFYSLVGLLVITKVVLEAEGRQPALAPAVTKVGKQPSPRLDKAG